MSATDVIVDQWKQFDWMARRSAMENALQQAKESTKASLATRKDLVETTKGFKRDVKAAEQACSAVGVPDPAKQSVEALSKQCKVVVKKYQEEINNLTVRCKNSETAYATLAQALMEMSDPTDALQGQTQMLATVERLTLELQQQEQKNAQQKKEIQQLKANSSGGDSGGGGNNGGGSLGNDEREELLSLRKEVAEYEVEFRSLKNQDITIRKLEARIAELQTTGEDALEEQLQKAKEELQETEGRRVTEALERESALERRVQTLEVELRAERAGSSAAQTHMLETDEGVSQREAAWEAQRRILVDDSTRLRETLSSATRERDELRLQVAAMEGTATSSSGSRSGMSPPPSGAGGASLADLVAERRAYEAEVAELSETASLLRDELRIKEDALADEKRTKQMQTDTWEREKASLQSNLASLESQLASAPSQALVDSMKRELRILKRLEYNAADDVDAMDRDPEIAGGGGDEKDLEAVLVAKLRRAESDLVTERMEKTDLRKQVDELKKSLALAEQAKDEADKLNFSLEKDLERAIATPASPSREHKAAMPTIKEGDPSTLQNILDPNAPSQPPPPPPAISTTETEKAQDDHSVATIVMAQRDRLRARCEALEAERDSFKRELQGQVQAAESLKADNTKLYEKVRYLQSYNRAPASRGHGADRDLDLEALEQRYEASVDPFRQFSKAERQRKLNEMSPMERAVFVVAKTVLATREMRTALFFYVLALHLLVFVTTYHWSHAGGCHNINNEHLAFLPHEQQTAARAAAQKAALEEQEGKEKRII